MSIDLVPFGFTPTESLVFTALIDRGPSSAYSISKQTGVARANVYQALNGLVSKGAANRISDTPQVFRPSRPSALLAMIAEQQTTRLDLLEAQISAHDQPGSEVTFSFENERSFKELALRTAVRATGVTCIATGTVMNTLTPIWRKRQADTAETELWLIGAEDPKPSVAMSGTVALEAVRKYFGTDPVLLLTPEAAILGHQEAGGRLSGHWSSDPLWIGALRGAADAITRA